MCRTSRPVETGPIWSSIETFTAAAADDGLLNRFLAIVVENAPALGSIAAPAPLPAVVVEWAGRVRKPMLAAELIHATAGPTVVAGYPGMEQAWREEMDEGQRKAENLPGVWGRLASKVLKVALIHAVLAEDGQLTPEGFAWARRFVHWATEGFARHFVAEGGGASNELDAIARAFMATFEAPALQGREVLSSTAFARYGGRAWRSCKDKLKRERVIEALIDDGEIERVDVKPHGVGYRKAPPTEV